MTVDMQKAGLWKRIAAAILDLILLAILAVGCAWGLTVMLDYDGHAETAATIKAEYEERFHIPPNVTTSVYQQMDEAEKKAYDEAVAEANKALAEDAEAVRILNLLQSLQLIITTFGILIAVLLLEFIVPLILKNGATVGKKVFGLGLVRTDCVRVNNLQLFTRTLIGKFTIEIMIPAYLVIMILDGSLGSMGVLVIGAILLLQVILYFATKQNQLLHDIMAGTAVVDVTSQRIFASDEDRVEFLKRMAAEQAEQQEYF